MGLEVEALGPQACGGLTVHTAVEHGGKMYVFGGSLDGAKTPNFWEYTPEPEATAGTAAGMVNPDGAATCEVGDREPARGEGRSSKGWRKIEAAGEAAPAHCMHSAVAHEGRMYVYGSRVEEEDGGRNCVWVYTFATNEWECLSPDGDAPWPAARTCVTAAVLAGGLYVFAGFSHFAGGVAFNCPDLWRLDLGTLVWSREWTWAGQSEGHAWEWAPANGPRPRHAHSTAAFGGELFIYGGDFGMGHDTDELWAYSAVAKAWRQVSGGGECPGTRYFHTAVVDGAAGRMYVFGQFVSRVCYEGGALVEREYAHGDRHQQAGGALAYGFESDRWAFHPLELRTGTATGGGGPLPRGSGMSAVLIGRSLYILGGHSDNRNAPHKGVKLDTMHVIRLGPPV